MALLLRTAIIVNMFILTASFYSSLAFHGALQSQISRRSPWDSFTRTCSRTASKTTIGRRNPSSIALGMAAQKKFMYMTEAQDRELKELGDGEASLMKSPKPLKVSKIKTGGGFGKSSDKSTAADVKSLAKLLQSDGIVRIDNVLSDSLCDALKDYLVDLRQRATKDVEDGLVDSRERFADVLLNQKRCDLRIPLGPEPVNEALRYLLDESSSILRSLITHVFDSYGSNGDLATLYELNCFMSNQGARRQLVHADNVFTEAIEGMDEKEPIMLTAFVSLQDTTVSMGPTVFLPGTHTIQHHREFFEVEETYKERKTKDALLKRQKAVVATLPKGSCALFDPRVLHCAGGNDCPDPTLTRALFYVSFKNPKIDDPGCPSCSGYGIADAEITLVDLVNELGGRTAPGRTSRRIDMLASFP